MTISSSSTSVAVAKEQGAVDVVEDLDRVGGEAGRAGHLRLEAAWQRVELGLDLLRRVGEQVLLIAAGFLGNRDRRRQECGAAIVRDQGGAGLGDGVGAHRVDLRPYPVVDRRAYPLDRGLIIGGQPAVAMKDGDRVGLIVGGKALQLIDRLHRLRAAGQIVGGVVLLSVLELARQGADREQDEDPDRDDRELGPAPTGKLGEPASD